MWVGRLGKQRVSRPLQSTGHRRGVEADPHPGVESLKLQHQLPWSSDLWVWTRATSCTLLHLHLCSADVKLSCQSPSLLGAFSVGLFIASSTLVLLGEGLVNRGWASTISLLEICSPSSGESCWYKPRCSWSWVPSCARLFSRQWAGGALSCSRVSRTGKEVQTLVWETLKAWTFFFMIFFSCEFCFSAMIKPSRWQTHGVEVFEVVDFQRSPKWPVTLLKIIILCRCSSFLGDPAWCFCN